MPIRATHRLATGGMRPTANIYSHLTWEVAMAAVHTIEARLCLVEARARGVDVLALSGPAPNPLFSHAA
ncbi:hypothetical protein ABH930_002725 [Kitasatospora sp. GAS204A]|uniref:hypothetical protein n=1 Tax=unclassified Kitasatospora TaxID=2633591 RepID=UPI00247673B4|nr:hypothetical protein [Kitasatospora sp. GAS204B]MDH6118976.1 hypothetical protein [Kitasatospora sp. GAS204B]